MQYAELLSPREHLQHKREKMQRELQAALLAKALACNSHCFHLALHQRLAQHHVKLFAVCAFTVAVAAAIKAPLASDGGTHVPAVPAVNASSTNFSQTSQTHHSRLDARDDNVALDSDQKFAAKGIGQGAACSCKAATSLYIHGR